MDGARITVERAVDPEGATLSLRNWLDGEDSLRGRVTMDEVPIGEGEMGAVSDVSMVALGSGGAGAVLATSLATWIRQLRSDVSVRIQRGETSVELHAARVQDESKLLEQLVSLLEQPVEETTNNRE
jgi:membrane-associated two-gene conflict system component 1 (EACC1)